jgi:hypothetical protein
VSKGGARWQGGARRQRGRTAARGEGAEGSSPAKGSSPARFIPRWPSPFAAIAVCSMAQCSVCSGSGRCRRRRKLAKRRVALTCGGASRARGHRGLYRWQFKSGPSLSIGPRLGQFGPGRHSLGLGRRSMPNVKLAMPSSPQHGAPRCTRCTRGLWGRYTHATCHLPHANGGVTHMPPSCALIEAPEPPPPPRAVALSRGPRCPCTLASCCAPLKMGSAMPGGASGSALFMAWEKTTQCGGGPLRRV